MAGWVDTLQLVLGGRRRLRRGLAVVARLELNHLGLDMRMVLAEETLLEELNRLPELPWLRSLGFFWPLRALRLEREATGTQASMVPAVSEQFLRRLLRDCPACRHLTHLGSDVAFSAQQADVIRAQGVMAILAGGRWWPHDLLPGSFRRPAAR
jgi:hypothetical protein